MTQQDTANQGSLASLLELAAELERRPARPSEHELRDLARRLALDVHTVRSATRLRYGETGAARSSPGGGPALMAVSRAAAWLPRWVNDWYARRPHITTGALTAVLMVVMGGILAGWGDSPISAGASLCAFIAYVLVVMALNYSLASVRTATRTAFVLAGLWLAILWLVLVGDAILQHTRLSLAEASAVALASAVAAVVVLVPVLTFTAAMGGYARTLSQLRKDRDTDRQTLLRRVFALSSKLDEQTTNAPLASRTGAATVTKAQGRVQRIAQERPALSAFLLVLGMCLLTETLLTLSRTLMPPQPGRLPIVPSLIDMFFVIVMLLGLFQLGLAAASVRKGMRMVLAVGAALVLAEAYSFGLGSLFRQGAVGPPGPPQVSFSILIVAARMFASSLPLLAGAMAGAYRVFIEHQRRLAAEEIPALQEEVERLRGRLRKEIRTAAFLCIDTVGSTAMKQGADPLAIEYSFTEFHRFIASRVIERGGAIHSTAGDGAIAVFEDVAPALDAGLAIQREISEFNSSMNTMRDPFRMRIGLHAGEVPGSGWSVAFSEVLDVAAHVERACPPGMVAMTGDAAATLVQQPPASCLPEPVDGRQVVVVEP